MHIATKIDEVDQPLWLEGGKYLLQWVRTPAGTAYTSAILRRPPSFEAERVIPVSTASPLYGRVDPYASFDIPGPDGPLGVTIDDQAVERPRMELLRLDIKTGFKPLGRCRVDLPARAEVWDIALSPDGRHMATLIHVPREHSRFAWAWRLLGVKARNEHSEILVADLTLGTVSSLGIAPDDTRTAMVRLVWMPDGKHLSFIRSEQLWMVPAF